MGWIIRLLLKLLLDIGGGIGGNFLYNKVFKNIDPLRRLVEAKKAADAIPTQFRLSQDRMDQISEWRKEYEEKLREIRPKHFEEIRKEQDKALRKDDSLLKEPAWKSLSTTPSEKKYRLVLGFRNKGCQYWRNDRDKVGCLHCSYGSAAIQDPKVKVTDEHLLDQYKYAVKWAKDREYKYDVIEFLNDGSFLNFDDESRKNEFTERFAIELFGKINNEQTYVKRVLIETRPKFVTEDRIISLLKCLTSNQMLEVGIGVETASDFVNRTCIRKGYGLAEFEQAVETIAAINMKPAFKDRCRVVVYIVVKPAFLTEKEAIADVIATLSYLSGIAKKHGIDIIPKLEPAAVVRSTILDILYSEVRSTKDEWYKPLSYWSIVEIIARAYILKLHSNVRVGAREDMDIVEKVPAIYGDNGMFNKYDFWIYDAVQRFNANGDIVRLFSDIAAVREKDRSLSFGKWQKEMDIDNPATTVCADMLAAKIRRCRKKDVQKERELFLSDVFEALNDIEWSQDGSDLARKLMGEEDKTRREKAIQSFFSNTMLPHFDRNYRIEVLEHSYEKDEHKLLRVYFQLYNKVEECSHDIWVGIPTKAENSRRPLNNVDSASPSDNP